MASQWTFGRIGVATTAGGDGLDLSGHYVMDFAGDECTIEADLDQDRALFASDAAAIAAQRILREQFRGYDLNTDEPVIQVTSLQDPTINGAYRVHTVEVVDTMATHFVGGIGSHVTAELSRVPVSQAPLFEVMCSAATRVNSHGATGASWIAVPGSALSLDTVSAPSVISIVGGGTIIAAVGPFTSTSIAYSVAPASHYEGSVKLLVADRSVIGRQVANDPGGWVLSNGLVRIRPSLIEANHIVVGVRNSGATDYDEKAFRLGFRAAGTNFEIGRDGINRVAPKTLTVLRNSPEAVAIRLTITYGVSSSFAGVANSNNLGHGNLDIMLRRGQTFAECHFATLGGAAVAGAFWGVWRGSAELGVDITTGVEASAADGAGNKYRIHTPRANTVDTTNGGVYLDSASASFPFALGNNRLILPSAATFADQYFEVQQHRQRIVAR